MTFDKNKYFELLELEKKYVSIIKSFINDVISADDFTNEFLALWTKFFITVKCLNLNQNKMRNIMLFG